MHFHYALVDDLVSREEFERRLEEKMHQCGDLVDEVAAAMLVVQDLGRHHVKIRGLGAKSSLYSFFGRVVAKNPPREFERPGGEKGLVTSLVLGDETGQVRAILWDEKAAACGEIAVGDVLEVIGRHATRSPTEITVMALRKAVCEISCSTAVEPHLAPPQRKNITVQLLATAVPRPVPRRDGSSGEMVEAMVGDSGGVTRMVVFSPELLAGIPEETPLLITGALEKMRQRGKEYQVDEKSTVEAADSEVTVRIHALDEVEDHGTYSVQGTVKSIQAPRAFTSREGRASHVRNLLLSGGTAELRVVLWGDLALQEIVPGDRLAVYLGTARTGKYGERELQAGGGSMVQVLPGSECEEVEVTGTVVATRSGTFLDTGAERYLVTGALPHGREVRLQGVRCGRRLSPSSWEEAAPDPGTVKAHLEALSRSLDASDTFTPHGREDISG
jgi:replication factor A1